MARVLSLNRPARALPLVIVWSVIALGSISVSAAASSSSSSTACDIVHLSDFHWDPYYGTSEGFGHCTNRSSSPFGENACDAPYSLIESAVQQAALVIAQSESSCVLALYTGDWVRHGAPSMPNANEEMVAIFRNMSQLLQSSVNQHQSQRRKKVALVPHPSLRVQPIASPTTKSVIAIPSNVGNEDFNPDYHLDVTNTNTSLLRNYSVALQDTGMLSASQATQFGYCGYYSMTVEQPNVTVLALNTVIYARDHSPATTLDDPCGQFAWLEAQLATARGEGRSVYLTAHVPPIAQLWNSNNFDSFQTIVASYEDVIAAQFYGHTHATQFAVFSNSSRMAPMFIGGSVTRVTTTNPTFQVYKVNPEGAWRVVEWTQWYLSSAMEWASWDVRSVLELPNLESDTLFVAGEALRNNNTFFGLFYPIFEGGTVPQGVTCSWVCQRLVSCMSYALSFLNVVECVL